VATTDGLMRAGTFLTSRRSTAAGASTPGGVHIRARGAELGGTRTGRRPGPSPEPSPRRAGRGGRGGVVRRHSGTGPKSGRIIPAIRRFTDSRRPGRTRFVSEPVWPGGPALVSGGSPGVPQRLAHDVKDDFLRLGGRPGLRRADTSLVDVGQQRDVRLALRSHLGHGPPAEHAF